MQSQEPEEPTDQEAHEYGAEKGLPTVTPDQVNIAKDQMKKDQEEEQPEPEKDEEDPKAEKPKQKMAASKYSEEIEELKSLAGLQEAMSDAYGGTDTNAEQVEGSVEFRQHKNTDKGSVSIEASGDDMQELAKVLKMAGLTLPNGMNPEPEHDEPEHDEPEHHDEPEAPCDSDEPEDKNVMVVSPQDASMSTDKEVLVNFLKDKLKKSIS